MFVLAVLATSAAAAAPLPLLVGGDNSADTGTRVIEVPEDIDAVALNALLATLTDAEARALLSSTLHEAIPDTDKRPGAHGGLGVALAQARLGLQRNAKRIGAELRQLGTGLASLSEGVSQALAKLRGPVGVGAHLVALVAALGLGALALAATRSRTGAWRAALDGGASLDVSARSVRAVGHLGLDLLAIIAFAVVALAVALVVAAHGRVLEVVLTAISGCLAVLAVSAVSRAIVSPTVAARRLLPLSDAAAAGWHRAVRTITLTVTATWLIAGLVILAGVSMPVHLAIVVIAGALSAGAVIACVVAARTPVANWLAEGEATSRHGLRGVLARRWHWLATGYIVVVWLLWSERMLARSATSVWSAVASVGVVAALPLLDRLARRALARCFPLAEASADAAARERFTHFRRVGLGMVRVVLGALAVALVLELWNLNPLPLMQPGARTAIAGALAEVALTVLVAWGLWRLFTAVVDPYLPEARAASQDEGGSTPLTRLQTLLPLARTTVLVVIVALTLMIGLSALGVDIAPLIAGAGVVGIAIGFGAQTLVKDIFSGIFFLIDDAFRVGEYIEFSEIRGEVEAITLRSLRLRHHRGAVHTVPFGELRSVTNYNRDWVIYKMEFRLPADTDVEKVRKLVKRIGVELLEDPEHGPNFLQPLKSQGIHRMEENALIIRTKFMCKPREQFVLRRVAYQRIKAAFAANGIHFAPRAVRVVGPTGAGDDEGAHSAAASAAVNEVT